MRPAAGSAIEERIEVAGIEANCSDHPGRATTGRDCGRHIEALEASRPPAPRTARHRSAGPGAQKPRWFESSYPGEVTTVTGS
jgi:hypothetical protein